MVAVAGADAGRAEALAEELIGQGVRALVSLGLAGGLSPDLRPGDPIWPAEVLAADGARLALYAGAHALAGTLIEASAVVATPGDKARLHAQTGALAVDMETAAVARAARVADLPVATIRAIADPADRALPPTATVAVLEDGTIAYRRLLGKLAGRPQDIAPLIRLGGDTKAAMGTLKRQAEEVIPALLETFGEG